MPALEPVPRDHVVTKTFYLLDSFVGRTENGQTWIEALPPVDPKDRANRPARAGDSVSPIIITSNDLAGAWAAREDGSPLYPLIPGGPRQREMALRGGVNLVMYALTGNYKADQVHARICWKGSRGERLVAEPFADLSALGSPLALAVAAVLVVGADRLGAAARGVLARARRGAAAVRRSPTPR